MVELEEPWEEGKLSKVLELRSEVRHDNVSFATFVGGSGVFEMSKDFFKSVHPSYAALLIVSAEERKKEK